MQRRTDEATCLSKPYCQATLAEHREANLDLVERRLRQHLRVERSDMRRHTSKHPVYDLPQIHNALAACFPEWKLEFEAGGEREWRNWCPSRVRWQIRPGEWRDFVDNGTLFYQLSDGTGRVLTLSGPHNTGDGEYYEFAIISRQDDQKTVTEESSILERWMRDNHYLRGQTLRADGSLLPQLPNLTWDDVSLAGHIREALIKNTAELLERRQLFQKHGVPQKRGLLLYGPPGTGKTMIGKVLASQGLATFIYATAGDCESLHSMRHLFQLARRLRPTILFLEDLDLFGADRSSQLRTGPLGELLAQMDGLEENDGLIIVATTNDLDAIEPALKDRPSRFDVVLEIGMPEKTERRRIVELSLPATVCCPAVSNRITEATDGFSGAQVRELAFLAIQTVLLRGDVSDACSLVVEDVDIKTARQQIIGSRERDGKVGFAYRETSPPLVTDAVPDRRHPRIRRTR